MFGAPTEITKTIWENSKNSEKFDLRDPVNQTKPLNVVAGELDEKKISTGRQIQSESLRSQLPQKTLTTEERFGQII